jgi:predicted ester cyclase
MAVDIRTLPERFYREALCQGRIEVIDEFVADDYVEHQIFPGLTQDKEGLKGFIKMNRDAFSDLNVEILKIVVEGDEAWVHAVMTGKHTGELGGIPATGKSVRLEMVDRVRFRDGKAVEHWGVSDDLGMMTQLGVVPELG